MSDAAWGQVITCVVLIAVLAVLWKPPVDRPGRPNLLRGLVVGKDNRVSTSLCVALAWTFVVAYLILASLITMWLGDSVGWKALQNDDWGPYLVFLGGPYAAGILAAMSAVSAAQTGAKTTSTKTPTASQLITNDAGDTDLGDFQYVLFNALAIAFVLVSFFGHLDKGLPTIPQVLWALALTSTGGYTAKKLLTDPLPVVKTPQAEQAAEAAADAAAGAKASPRTRFRGYPQPD
jgi:hypothetical protein